MPSDADEDYYLIVKCPEPKKDASGKVVKSQAFMSTINVAGNMANYLNLYIYDMDENDVNSLYGYVRQAKPTLPGRGGSDGGVYLWLVYSPAPSHSLVVSLLPPTNSEYYYNIGFFTCVDGVLGSSYY